MSTRLSLQSNENQVAIRKKQTIGNINKKKTKL